MEDRLHYFETVPLNDVALKTAKESALTQEQRIKRLFYGMPPGWLATPEKIREKLGTRAPITSIRRAVTMLTAEGFLIRTDKTAPGRYGRPVHLWRMSTTRDTSEA